MDKAKVGDSGAAVQFGRLPYRVVASGALSKLSRNELAAYQTIAVHVGPTWAATIAAATIARVGGMSERTARRAVNGLRDKGLIRVDAGGGRGRANTYTLSTNPDTLGGTLSATPNPDKTTAKPCHAEPETLTKRPRNPDTIGGRRTDEQSEKSNRARPCGRAAAERRSGKHNRPDGIDADVLNALTAAGIGEPKRSELARIWADIENAAQTISTVAAECRGQNKGTGVIVLELDARVEAERAKARERQSAARAEQERRDEKAAEKKRAEEEAANRAAIIDKMGDEELLAWAWLVVRLASAAARRRWAADVQDVAAVRRHRGIRTRVARLVSAGVQLTHLNDGGWRFRFNGTGGGFELDEGAVQEGTATGGGSAVGETVNAT